MKRNSILDAICVFISTAYIPLEYILSEMVRVHKMNIGKRHFSSVYQWNSFHFLDFN